MRISPLALSILATVGTTGAALSSPAPASVSVAPPSVAVEATPTLPQTTRSTPRPSQPIDNDLGVMATGVQVQGVDLELQQIALENISTRTGAPTSDGQLQRDTQILLNTGLFEKVEVKKIANSNGWDIAYQMQPTIVRSLQLQNAQILTPEIAQQIFQNQLDRPISPTLIQQSMDQLNQWYADNGYVLAQVADVRSLPNGILNIDVAEGIVSAVKIRFVDAEGQEVKGRTQTSLIEDNLTLKPGQIFKLETARQDLAQLQKLGLFKQANLDLDGNARQVAVTYELEEQPARSINAGGGYSDVSGLFGTISYNDRNLGGIGQNLDLNIQAGLRDLQFDASFGSPYRASNPDTPGYSINAFRHRGIAANLGREARLANGDRPREGRFGGGVNLTKPIGDVNASVGVNYDRVSIRDRNGDLAPVDSNGNPLTFSQSGIDDLVTVQAGVNLDRRDNPTNPTSGSVVSLSSAQSLPVGQGQILSNRLEASFSNYTPTTVFDRDHPEVLAFNVQAGTTIGDLPPYQVFSLGGANSVRGYNTGELARGRSFVLASAEYRVPLFASPVSGVLFADFGTDLGSSAPVQGPGGTIETLPGTGFGYGAGLRVNSPIGVLRADLGFNTQGETRLQFGIGHRF